MTKVMITPTGSHLSATLVFACGVYLYKLKDKSERLQRSLFLKNRELYFVNSSYKNHQEDKTIFYNENVETRGAIVLIHVKHTLYHFQK
ncbi:hypothetical protein [Flavobacterium cellulosilyticum]|uniref:Uncharacterized protein n=1 Tax=Flavobacterium cellulosilyticum TaxID=2541731 RepID=A0A4R5CHT2_9FLAO|nr:hypothetical protein [Flavobacterium cellulosilyticum]TDD98659.1 hypothetical protein E0F76_05905 [Flavobacterium cellulosilyticum]